MCVFFQPAGCDHGGVRFQLKPILLYNNPLKLRTLRFCSRSGGARLNCGQQAYRLPLRDIAACFELARRYWRWRR